MTAADLIARKTQYFLDRIRAKTMSADEAEKPFDRYALTPLRVESSGAWVAC